MLHGCKLYVTMAGTKTLWLATIRSFIFLQCVTLWIFFGGPMIPLPNMLVFATKSMSETFPKRFQKDCHHFEVNIRTQQMLENFIEANQCQMQLLADEINRVGNVAVNNNLYLRVLKRHSWKGLKKFNLVQGLRKARIYKDYEYLNQNFSRDDTVVRPNQKLPPLHKVDEVFFVNEPEPIRPDTNDSVTSKDDEGLDD